MSPTRAPTARKSFDIGERAPRDGSCDLASLLPRLGTRHTAPTLQSSAARMKNEALVGSVAASGCSANRAPNASNVLRQRSCLTVLIEGFGVPSKAATRSWP